MVNAYQQNLDLRPGGREPQARVRGAILMAISNAEGHLVLATGNKSELAVGYSTIYGDAVGGFAPIRMPKTLVWEMARWRNDSAVRSGQPGPIPPNSIDKPPAELRRTNWTPTRCRTTCSWTASWMTMWAATWARPNSWNAATTPNWSRASCSSPTPRNGNAGSTPGTKITFRAFGRDRRLPITSRWREPLA